MSFVLHAAALECEHVYQHYLHGANQLHACHLAKHMR